jgi:poly-gamma-glutamate synthesis protein (capsule biosynthesis protein)
MSASFSAAVLDIPPHMQNEMRGRSWHDQLDCPPFAALRLLRLSHHGFDNLVHTGELVVAAQVAAEVLEIFEQLFEARFPIAQMRRVDAFDGSDDASMAANNTSAFNFRRVQGTQLLSHHARGLAIDINPVQNPWVRGERVDPPAARAYLDRAVLRPGMIAREGPVVNAFEARGWYWGGDFTDMRDYHHFSKLPR